MTETPLDPVVFGPMYELPSRGLAPMCTDECRRQHTPPIVLKLATPRSA